MNWSGRKGTCCYSVLVDIMHMGLVDEVVFGRELVERLPQLVEEWKALVSIRDDEPCPDL